VKTTLVRVEELAAAPGWRVVDCRHDLTVPNAGRAQYDQGHIPGAVHAHLDSVMSGAKDGRNGRHPLPDRRALADWLGAQGIGPQDQVVVYDAAGGAMAARLWWLLRWLGHEAVAVLDGGWQAWVQAGLPVSTDLPAPAPTTFPVGESRVRTVTTQDVAGNLATGRQQVVDARAAGRYAGIGETLDPKGGHIPGAINRPFADNLAANGHFKPADSLRAEWAAVLQGKPPRDVIAQCGSGVTACHNLLALEVAGLGGAALYPGSWSAWCSDDSRPVATGPTP